MDTVVTFRSLSAEDTIRFGSEFAESHLHSGSVAVLRGELGAGKTQFAKGIARRYGLDEDDIASPTYALVNEYDIEISGNNAKLYHLDCYRFEKPEELLELGVEEYLYPKNGITIIEWPERIEAFLPKQRIEIAIEVLTPTERNIIVSSLTTTN